MKKVVKFGGSSLASADQFKKVGAIIHADENRRYVVPSAPGKRFSSDIKVTDMLYACYDAAVKGEDFSEQLENIKARYQEIIDGLNLDCSLDEDFEIIRGNFDLRPAGIIQMLDLRKPVYRQTAAYGHFGRNDLDLTWERLDKVDVLKQYLND